MSYQKRKIEIREHEAWQKSIASKSPAPDYDEIDLLVADPLTERYAKPRKESKTANVLSILDELAKGRSGK